MISENKLYAPIKNYSPSIITSKYNEVSSVRNNRQHKGLDLGVQSGTQVLAPQDGTIKTSQITQGNCGGLIEITHANNITTRYCHLKNLNVKVGQTVKAGEVIGLSGGAANDYGKGLSTGAHLHFEVLAGNQFVDPEKYLSGNIAGLKGNQSSVLNKYGGTSSSSKTYILGRGATSSSEKTYNMYNPNQQQPIPESVKNDIKNIEKYYKKLNIPILLESRFFKPKKLTKIGKEIVSSFSKKENKEFSDNYTYKAIGTEFRCNFNKCETNIRGGCYVVEINYNNLNYYIHICADDFEIKNKIARKNDIIANIKSNNKHYSVTVTRGLSTEILLVDSSVGDDDEDNDNNNTDIKIDKFKYGGTSSSSKTYKLGQGGTSMSNKSYTLGNGGTSSSSKTYKLGQGGTSMSSNEYTLGKGGTSMSNENYMLNDIEITENIKYEINRICQIL